MFSTNTTKFFVTKTFIEYMYIMSFSDIPNELVYVLHWKIGFFHANDISKPVISKCSSFLGEKDYGDSISGHFAT
jgi:hypothetical protein